jgi:hypothetical protein
MVDLSDTSVTSDPRWKAFNGEGFMCSCGWRHIGMFPINLLMPMSWDGDQTYEDDSALVMDRTFLSASYCVWQGQSFALRVRLPLTVKGVTPFSFMFTVWANVTKPDFETYVAAKKANRLNSGIKFPARLVNRLAGFHDTANLMGTAFQQDDVWPPILVLGPEQPFTNRPDHPLIAEQRNGIEFTRALELFAIYGHDMRQAAATAAG